PPTHPLSLHDALPILHPGGCTHPTNQTREYRARNSEAQLPAKEEHQDADDRRKNLVQQRDEENGHGSAPVAADDPVRGGSAKLRSEEHTSELQSLRHL